jgi:hypothetical protein
MTGTGLPPGPFGLPSVRRSAFSYLWSAPVSAPAALLALMARVSGGSVCWRDGVLEAEGGWLRPVLSRMYPPMAISAMTLGHVVLAQSAACLEATRAHERAHVRQYEQWGPLFPALYLLASLEAWFRGGHLYRDNRFECEARLAEAGRPPAGQGNTAA